MLQNKSYGRLDCNFRLTVAQIVHSFRITSLSFCKYSHLCSCSMMMKTRKLALMLLTLALTQIVSFYCCCYSVPGSNSGSCISCNCQVPLVFSSQGQFLILSFLVLVEYPLSLYLSDVSSWLD